MDDKLHSPRRRLIEPRIEHADLGGLIDTLADAVPIEGRSLRRPKKRRSLLNDAIARFEYEIDPPGPA